MFMAIGYGHYCGFKFTFTQRYPHSQLKNSHFPTLEGESFTTVPLRDSSRNSPNLVRNLPKLNITLPFIDLKHTCMYIPIHSWIIPSMYILCYVLGRPGLKRTQKHTRKQTSTHARHRDGAVIIGKGPRMKGT